MTKRVYIYLPILEPLLVIEIVTLTIHSNHDGGTLFFVESTCLHNSVTGTKKDEMTNKYNRLTFAGNVHT